jgi:hypothetical protein
VDSADLAMMYQGPFTTAFYRQLHLVLHKEFRSQRGLEALKQVIRQPSKLRPYHLRELIAIPYRLGTLPLARAKLNQLATLPNAAIQPPPHMTLEEAAAPSPQE